VLSANQEEIEEGRKHNLKGRKKSPEETSLGLERDKAVPKEKLPAALRWATQMLWGGGGVGAFEKGCVETLVVEWVRDEEGKGGVPYILMKGANDWVTWRTGSCRGFRRL